MNDLKGRHAHLENRTEILDFPKLNRSDRLNFK